MRGWGVIVREFCRALGSARTYSPLDNVYTVFGFLWGVPIPLFALAIHLAVAREPFTLGSVADCVHDFPLHYFFLAHPLIFAVVFGAMGTVRLVKDEQIRDLLRQHEGQLRHLGDANRILREMDQMRNDFLANMSHDLKTPLVSISGYAEMLLTGRLGDATEKQKNAAQVILRNTDYLLSMIDDLLDLAHMRTRGLELRKERFHLAEMIAECRFEFEPRLQEKEIQMVAQVDPALEIEGDRKRLRRALENLISTSIDFCGSEGMIEVVARPGDGRADVRIQDNGVGIPAHLLENLFERFWQGDLTGSGDEKGTGLGLAIAREIVEAHGGEISVSSAVGRGTEFRFDLPVAGREGIRELH